MTPASPAPVPVGLLEPVGLWVFNYVIPAATIVILAVAIRGCTQRRGFGPIWHFARGSQPLLWPVTLMVGWPNLVAYVAGKPVSSGPNVIERTFRLDPRGQPGARFEAKRFGAWLLTFQVTFFVMLVVPLVVLRLATGHDSPYVP